MVYTMKNLEYSMTYKIIVLLIQDQTTKLFQLSSIILRVSQHIFLGQIIEIEKLLKTLKIIS